MMYSISPCGSMDMPPGKCGGRGNRLGPLSVKKAESLGFQGLRLCSVTCGFLWRFRQQRGEGADAHRLRRGGRDWGSCSTRMMSSPKRRTELQGM